MFVHGYTNCDTILADFIMQICFSKEILQHNWRLIKPSIPEVKNTNFFYDDITDDDIREEYLNTIYNKILEEREVLISTSYKPDTKWLEQKEMHVINISNIQDEYIVIEPKEKIYKDTVVEVTYRDMNLRFHQNLEKKLTYLEFYVDYDENKIYLKSELPEIDEQYIYDIRYQIKNDEIYTWYVSMSYPWRGVMYPSTLNKSILCWQFGKELDEFGILIPNKGVESPLFTCCFHHIDTKKYYIDTWLPIEYYITWDNQSVSFMFCEEPVVKVPIYGWCFFGAINNAKQAEFDDYYGNFGSFGNFEANNINLSGAIDPKELELFDISVDVISYKYEEPIIYEQRNDIVSMVDSNIFIDLDQTITLLDPPNLPIELSMMKGNKLQYLRTLHSITGNYIKYVIEYLLPYPDTKISGYVWAEKRVPDGIMQNEEPKLAGVKVSLIETLTNNIIKNTTTNNEGYYLFEKFEEGLYHLLFDYSPVKSQYNIMEFTKKDVSTPDISSSAYKNTGLTDSNNVIETNYITLNAGVRVFNGKIYGYVWEDKYPGDGLWKTNEGEDGINGVIVILYDINDVEIKRTTSANNGGKKGYYEFTKLDDGFYYVNFDFSLTTYTQITKKDIGSAEVSSSVNQPTKKTDVIEIRNEEEDIIKNCGLIKLEPVIVKGKVWFDNDLKDGLIDEGIEIFAKDVTATLIDKDNNIIDTKTSSSSGDFSFTTLEGFYKLRFDYSKNEFAAKIKGYTDIVPGPEELVSCVNPDGYSNLFEVRVSNSPALKNCGLDMPIPGFEVRYVYESCSYAYGYQGILVDYDTNKIILEFNTFTNVSNLFSNKCVTYSTSSMTKLKDLPNGIQLGYKRVRITVQDLDYGQTSFRIRYNASGSQDARLGFYLMNREGNDHDFHSNLTKVIVNEVEYIYTNWNFPGVPSLNYSVGQTIDPHNITSYKLPGGSLSTVNPAKPVATIDTSQSNELDMFVPILDPTTNKPYPYNLV